MSVTHECDTRWMWHTMNETCHTWMSHEWVHVNELHVKSPGWVEWVTNETWIRHEWDIYIYIYTYICMYTWMSHEWVARESVTTDLCHAWTSHASRVDYIYICMYWTHICTHVCVYVLNTHMDTLSFSSPLHTKIHTQTRTHTHTHKHSPVKHTKSERMHNSKLFMYSKPTHTYTHTHSCSEETTKTHQPYEPLYIQHTHRNTHTHTHKHTHTQTQTRSFQASNIDLLKTSTMPTSINIQLTDSHTQTHTHTYTQRLKSICRAQTTWTHQPCQLHTHTHR